ncbi:MAG: HesA/MoeB/ThiF family protein [Gammaproteobacteria bacterium]|nr:HesA/MoeB/ThiF family protein [Gammaproteobacteria bacterium]
MDDRELLYHSAHILLPQIGIEGVERIRAAHILVVGAGGLGTAAATYLARSGVGRLTLIDDDTVSASNLPRQILYGEDDIGTPKVIAAFRALGRCAPGEITIRGERLAGEALAQAVAGADLVCDASDNFLTRFALNAACVRHAIPLVSAAVIRFEGQLLAVHPAMPQAGCYRCLYNDEAYADEPRCADRGVFAPAAGVMGSLQALAALKMVAGVAEPLCEALLLFDGLAQTSHTIGRRRDPGCPVCGLAA